MGYLGYCVGDCDNNSIIALTAFILHMIKALDEFVGA